MGHHEGRPVAAKAFLKRAIQPAPPNLNIHSEREMLIVARALHALAQGRLTHAADILAQRFKALQASVLLSNRVPAIVTRQY